MKIIKTLLLLALLSLTGCANHGITYVPTPVKCPAPKPLPEPKYQILSANPTPAEYVKKICVVNNKVCRDALTQCKLVLDGYK